MDFVISKDSTPSCLPAVLPRVGQAFVNVAAAAGATLIPALTSVTGDKAFSNVLVANTGCKPIRITATYLQGGDCAACNNPDILTTATILVDIPAGATKWELPAGYVTAVSFQTLNVVGSTGVPTNVSVAQDVIFYATSAQTCETCAVFVP